MFKIFKNRKAQGTLEYALIIAVVIAALVAMNAYMKRAVQGRMRESIDSVGDQYSAGNMTSTYRTVQTGNMVTTEEYGTSTLGQGVSRYEITTAPAVTTQATGDEAETTTSGAAFKDESLF